MCEGLGERAAVVVAQALLKLLGGELAIRLDHGPLAVHPLGSIGFSHGLLLGRRQTRSRQPPSRLTRRLWAAIQARTSRLTCQGALSQIRSRTRTPSAASRPATQARKAQVTPLTGRPATNRSSIRSRSGSHRP